MAIWLASTPGDLNHILLTPSLPQLNLLRACTISSAFFHFLLLMGSICQWLDVSFMNLAITHNEVDNQGEHMTLYIAPDTDKWGQLKVKLARIEIIVGGHHQLIKHHQCPHISHPKWSTCPLSCNAFTNPRPVQLSRSLSQNLLPPNYITHTTKNDDGSLYFFAFLLFEPIK